MHWIIQKHTVNTNVLHCWCLIPSVWFCFLLQAEFSELNLTAYVTGGCMVDMQIVKNGTKTVW